ncbi:MAG: TAG lipase/steryl ester hydrolase/phospholipase A2/LPA acyltransferase [Halioglobus sp.]
MQNRRKLKNLDKRMSQAASYDEWLEAAQQHDELSGEKRWRQVDQTSQYDYTQIRLRLDKIRSLRARHDYQGLLFTLNEGIHGNMGGMGRSSLYNRAQAGTKRLIEQYVDEVDDSLRFLAELDNDVIDVQDKLDFFYRSNVCFGRSALMLSGGGVLGFYHLGVVKTLLEQDLLPKVISGASAGSLVAGVLGTHTDKELEHFYDPANVHFEAEREANTFSKMFFGANPQIDVSDLENLIARMVPDMTFQEAYEKTGRQISVSVAPAELYQRSRLLNAIASPNVYIRSAVMASCAVPGVFPPVMLMAKNQHGEPQPYLPTRKWVDGSISDDLPAKRLQRMYSTNHFIVSMVNPIAIPFLRNSEKRSAVGAVGAALSGLGIGVSREVLNYYRTMVQRRNESWPRFNMLVNSLHALVDQEYSGDINIVPSFTFYNPGKLLSHLSEKDLIGLMQGGEISTYPTVEAIRTCTKISRTMEEILHRFERGDLRPDESDYHRPSASRRRPTPTRADRDAQREHRLNSTRVKKDAPVNKVSPKKRSPRPKVAAAAKATQKKPKAKRKAA